MEKNLTVENILFESEIMLLPAYCTAQNVIIEPEQKLIDLTIDELSVLYLLMQNIHPNEDIETLIYARDAIILIYGRIIKNRLI